MPELEAFCDLPFTKIKVSPRGEVRMCCYQAGSLGNILRQDFLAIWPSKLAQDVRDSTGASQLHPMCKGWGGCPYLVRDKVPFKIRLSHGFPTFLELDLPNTHCNIGGTAPTPDTACFMCPRGAVDFSPDPDLTSKLVERLRFLMPYLGRLTVVGLAEVFWKGRVFEVLEQFEFQKYNRGCFFTTFTNGTQFDEQTQERFIEMCPKALLLFSLDAATPETYRKVRRINAFSRIVENIRGFVRRRGSTQSVRIANNINLINVDECVKMVELGKDLGVDGIVFNPTHTAAKKRDDIEWAVVNDSNYRRFAEAENMILRRAAELEIPVTFYRPLDLGFSADEMNPPPATASLHTIKPLSV
jgi:Iron-sulfur cluster-binding domain